MSAPLETLLHDPRLWRAGRSRHGYPVLATGYSRLDAFLPGGGWPADRLTEVAVDRWGSGELVLFLPLLARLSRPEPGCAAGWIAWIAPPFMPYAPALAAAGVDPGRMLVVRAIDEDEALWSAEQAARSGACRLVLAWVTRSRASGLQATRLRRLQLAAEAGGVPLVLFRPPAAFAAPSAATLRLRIEADRHGARLRLHKHRGSAREVLPLAALQGP